MTDNIFKIGGDGIEAADKRVTNLMNDMVNAETPGYRKSVVAVRAFPLELKAAEERQKFISGPMSPMVEGTYLSHTPGALVKTGNDTDLAIGGDGFFVIEGPFGDGYTRDGRFVVNNEGRLVTAIGGHTVLGRGGPIDIPPGSKVLITPTGEIKVDDETLAEIRIVKFSDPSRLEYVTGSIFKSGAGITVEEVASPRVIQGYIESSNVSMVDSMMELVVLSRIYNINTKIIQSRDASLSRAIDMARMAP